MSACQPAADSLIDDSAVPSLCQNADPDFDSWFRDMLLGPESSEVPASNFANAEHHPHALIDVTADHEDQRLALGSTRGMGSSVGRMPSSRNAFQEESESSARETRQISTTKRNSRTGDSSSARSKLRLAVNTTRYRQRLADRLKTAEVTHPELRMRLANALAFQSLWGATIDEMSATFRSTGTVVLSRAMLGSAYLIGPLAPDILQLTSLGRGDLMSHLTIDPNRLDLRDYIPSESFDTDTSFGVARGRQVPTDHTKLFANSPTPLSLFCNPLQSICRYAPGSQPIHTNRGTA